LVGVDAVAAEEVAQAGHHGDEAGEVGGRDVKFGRVGSLA
jgi:hypothetical protein